MTTLKDAIDDLFNNRRLAADEAVDRHFAPAFRQRVNGTWDDRSGFLARVVQLRESVEHVTVTVLDELTDGNSYAERHIVELVQRDGERAGQEVYVFAERDPDGRFVRIEETALALDSGRPGVGQGPAHAQ
ncbi:nuclear transport factor 2 family protein [Streptomyces longispororuber]|uniref:nuclear transport factor 2 family protein n=1 Tax=Streptomyces longispororuber TaxID=68230 RepID=UPI00210AD83A|nr:nuclear transport factor 2 family protein [Streptomyces longispororuber]MCQ4206929.1 nuclear transport factor 2 family protein [Streptomyces longispororuber]